MSISFFDLPLEILKEIFSCLPDNYLRKIIQLKPSLTEIANDALYHRITVGESPSRTLGFTDDVIDIKPTGFDLLSFMRQTRIEYPEELIRKINTKEIRKPETITFEKTSDLFHTMRLDRYVLNNVKVGMAMNEFGQASSDDPVTDVLSIFLDFDGCDFTRIFYLPSNWFLRYAATIERYGWFVELHPEEYAIRFLFKVLPNLIMLTINGFMEKKALLYLPNHLSVCKCSLASDDVCSDDKLAFPDTLRSLTLVVDDKPATFNISHLENLIDFIVENPNIHQHFILPSTLDHFESRYGYVYISEILQQCLKLRYLIYCEFLGFQIKTNNHTLPQSNLIKLQLPSHELYARNHIQSIALPPTLEILEVFGSISTVAIVDSTIIDFERTNFKNLKVLRLIKVEMLMIEGSLPSSLTKVDIVSQPSFQFHKLNNLPNLKQLCLEDVDLSNIHTFNFSSSSSNLELLRMTQCKISTAHITAPNLLYLNLSGNKFTTIDKSTLTVPESVIEFELSSNPLTTISNDFNFPPHLRQLIIANVSINSITNLPDSLTHLRMYNNETSMSWHITTLPRYLTNVQLSGIRITKSDLDIMNLRQFKVLKRLSLSTNLIEMLDVGMFPRSLTHLLVQRNRIEEIIGSFGDLKELIELDISDNRIGAYLNDKDSLFGKGIIYLNYERNETVVAPKNPKEKKSTMKKLKSKFGRLSIGKK
ncbi:hypothetical protein G210_1071 [Candida maltosa Xu316]|uniref:F-box domain-containing protein n=1 Tax=Candida maltosa (strain Xu316) TaxID=1245528 RepID=M3JZB4_CANMX|nr:hypothetical protein G210_1071 [Candida maltosa Xu316]